MAAKWNEYTKMLMNKAAKEKIPFWGCFELTPRCNFHCKMCYVCRQLNDQEALAKELTAKQWIQIAREARDQGLLYLTLTGGEVLAFKDFPIIYKEIAQMGFIITVLTNASLVNRKIADLFERYMPSRVSTTIYGASPETYKKVTGDASGFERTIKGIDLLLDIGVDLVIKTTVIKENASEFNKIAEIADNRGAKFAVVDYISPRREGSCSDPLGNRLSPAELADFEMQINKYNFKNKNRILSNNDFELVESDYLTQIIKDQPKFENWKSAFNCYVGKCQFWVTWDGRLTPCGMLNKPEAFPLISGFRDAYRKINEQVNTISPCEDCRSCDVRDSCMTCPAKLFAETGKYDKAAPYFCEYMKEKSKLKDHAQRA